jgi:glycosyltransferase involved in cell wall biosynthesis
MKISVVMPSYNQCQFIDEAIQSIINQSYQNFELIIMDAVSTDGTEEVLARYRQHPQVRISIKKDKGQADALAKGFAQCSGDIYTWLNSDDVLASGAFEHVVETFSANPEVDILNGELNVIDEQSSFIAVWPRKKIATKQWMHFPQTIGQPSTFFRASLYTKVGGVNPAYHYAMDYDLFFRMVLAGAKIRYIDTVLAGFRVHSQSKTIALPFKFWREELSIFYKLSNKKLLSGFYYWKFRGIVSTIIKQKILNTRQF